MSLLYAPEVFEMQPPTGWLRLLYHDQTRAKYQILKLIDQIPDGRVPDPELVRRVLILIAQHTRGLLVSGDGGREALEAKLRGHLLAGHKRATPRILNAMIPDRRIRGWVAIAYLSFKPLLLIAVCVAMFRYGLSVLGYVIAVLLGISVVVKLLTLLLGALHLRKHPYTLEAVKYQNVVDSCLDSGDLAGAEQGYEKLRALLLLHPDDAVIKSTTERAAQKIASHRMRKP